MNESEDWGGDLSLSPYLHDGYNFTAVMTMMTLLLYDHISVTVQNEENRKENNKMLFVTAKEMCIRDRLYTVLF